MKPTIKSVKINRIDLEFADYPLKDEEAPILVFLQDSGYDSTEEMLELIEKSWGEFSSDFVKEAMLLQYKKEKMGVFIEKPLMKPLFPIHVTMQHC